MEMASERFRRKRSTRCIPARVVARNRDGESMSKSEDTERQTRMDDIKWWKREGQIRTYTQKTSGVEAFKREIPDFDP